MTTSTQSTIERRGASWCRSGERRGNWAPINIATMVIGFMIFWPFGLAVLAWIATGHHVRELPGAARELWSRVSGDGGPRFARATASDNVVFNDYQQAQYDRIREIRAEIGERARRFAEFRADSRRRADQEEFDRFMAGSPIDGERRDDERS